MKNSKEIQISEYLNTLLASELKPEEQIILQRAATALAKQAYLPKIIANLEADLTPLAIKSQLSPALGEFYLTITSARFKDHDLGRGVVTLGFLHP